MANIQMGKARGSVWFQRQQRSEGYVSEVAFLNKQLDRMSAVLASSKAAASNKRLKSQIREKRNLFQTAIDLANGKKAYYSVPRSGRVPTSGDQFMAWVMEAVSDIDPMFERAHVTLEGDIEPMTVLHDELETLGAQGEASDQIKDWVSSLVSEARTAVDPSITLKDTK